MAVDEVRRVRTNGRHECTDAGALHCIDGRVNRCCRKMAISMDGQEVPCRLKNPRLRSGAQIQVLVPEVDRKRLLVRWVSVGSHVDLNDTQMRILPPGRSPLGDCRKAVRPVMWQSHAHEVRDCEVA